jgi:hypothetical protein
LCIAGRSCRRRGNHTREFPRVCKAFQVVLEVVLDLRVVITSLISRNRSDVGKDCRRSCQEDAMQSLAKARRARRPHQSKPVLILHSLSGARLPSLDAKCPCCLADIWRGLTRRSSGISRENKLRTGDRVSCPRCQHMLMLCAEAATDTSPPRLCFVHVGRGAGRPKLCSRCRKHLDATGTARDATSLLRAVIADDCRLCERCHRATCDSARTVGNDS